MQYKKDFISCVVFCSGCVTVTLRSCSFFFSLLFRAKWDFIRKMNEEEEKQEKRIVIIMLIIVLGWQMIIMIAYVFFLADFALSLFTSLAVQQNTYFLVVMPFFPSLKYIICMGSEYIIIIIFCSRSVFFYAASICTSSWVFFFLRLTHLHCVFW